MKFLKDNIVGVVVILSALMWIPVCWYIKKYDGHLLKAAKEQSPEKVPLSQRLSVPRPPPQPRRSTSSQRSVAGSSTGGMPETSLRTRNNFGSKLPRNPAHKRSQVLRTSGRFNGAAEFAHQRSKPRNSRLPSTEEEENSIGVIGDHHRHETRSGREYNVPPLTVGLPPAVSYSTRFGPNFQPHVHIAHAAPVAVSEDEDDVDTENSMNEAAAEIGGLKGFNI